MIRESRSAGALCCVVATMVCVPAGTVRADVEVDLRRGGGSVRADSATGDLGGLTVRGPQLWSDEGPLSERYRGAVLPWDLVREVRGDSAGMGDFLAIGEDLWRARIRIERGDEALAQPILAKHWTRFRDAEGPTAALVAERLLATPLRRPFLGGGVQLRTGFRTGAQGQALLFRHIDLAVQESAIVRWLGNLGFTAVSEHEGPADEEEDRFLVELFRALRDDLTALSRTLPAAPPPG